MSYVDDIQKINKLAKEMMAHGMAASLDEAVSKAQDTLRKSGAIQIDLTEMNRNLEREQEMRKGVVGEVKADPNSGQATFQSPQQNTAVDSGITWQEAMTRNTKFVVAQFKDMQNAIKILMAEVQQLKRDAATTRRSHPPQYQTPSTEQVINIDDSPKEEVKSGDGEYSKDHPKQGNFTSDDVSITKVFDYSNK